MREAGDRWQQDEVPPHRVARPRKEDERLLTGRGRYVDDIDVPGALHACFVRSPHAHARIGAIDVQAALEMPGVVAVFTGKDVAAWTTRHRMAPPIEGLQPVEMDTLPVDKVRFQGDPVACVIAQRPLCRRRRGGAGGGGVRGVAGGDLDVAGARARVAARGRNPAVQSALASARHARRCASANAPGPSRGRERFLAASPDPPADRDARLHRHVGRGPAAPHFPRRHPGAASVPHARWPAGCGCRSRR